MKTQMAILLLSDDRSWIGRFTFQELIHVDYIMVSYMTAVEERLAELPDTSLRREGLEATLATADAIHEIIQEGIYTRREAIRKRGTK